MIVKDGIKMPRRSTIGSAGYDFFSPDTYELKPNEWTMIDTGVSLEGNEYVYTKFDTCMLHDFEKWFMMLAPRSGLSNKYGFRIRNTIGIIDMDYRDTIKVMVTVDEVYTLEKGEKFVQGIILPFGVFTGEIKPSETRTGGHGSTGRF